MANPCAVVGIGQTKHDTKRVDVSLPGLLREAVDRAFADASVGWRDIDAVVIGKAPDMFEGTMMPELYLADEVFVTGTAAELVPVREIDDHRVGSGEPGEITRAVQKSFDDALHGRIERYREWLDPVPVPARQQVA